MVAIIIKVLMYLSGVLTNQLLGISAAQRKNRQSFLYSKYISDNLANILIAVGLMLPFVMYTEDVMRFVGLEIKQDSAAGLHCFIGGLLLNVIIAKLQKIIK